MSSLSTSSGAGGGGDSAIESFVALATSPAARNVLFALVAAAGVALSARTMKGERQNRDKSQRSKAERAPSPPPKDVDGRTGPTSSSLEEHLAQQSSRRHIRRSSGSSVALGMSNSTGSGGKSAVAIFWDVDNCSPPTGSSGHDVARAIRKAAQSAGVSGELANRTGSIVSFKAYLELSSENATPNAAQVQLRSELQGSGVSLIDTPKSGRKDVADKMMIADLLSFAIDKRPPALIVLLSGDRDFAYPLGILRNRGYDVLLITPPIGATPILEASATYVLKWRQDVLGIDRDGYGRLYDKEARLLEERGSGTSAKESNTIKASNAPRFDDTNPNSAARQTPARDFGKPTNLTPASLRKSGSGPTPPVFVPLVQVLQQLQHEDQNHPKRSIVALRLRALEPKVYEKAGANSWGEYVAVAESAGIVKLGNGVQSGYEWIALRDAPGPNPPGPKVGANSMEASANVSGNPAGYDISLFYPLIEVWRQSKAGSSNSPKASTIASQLDHMVKSRFVDAYGQAGVRTFPEYMRLAEQAKVGRVVQLDSKDRETVIEIHPRYSSLHTSMIMPNNPSARIIDANKVEAPEVRQNKLAAFLSGANKKKDANAPESAQASTSKECSFPLGPAVPHQPSGEAIHAAFFPLANCLLTHRAEGDFLTTDHAVKATISKHHKTGKFVSTAHEFEVYLARAEEDDIVRVVSQGDDRFIALSPRLCRGEGEDKHKGFVRGVNSGTNRPGMNGNYGSNGDVETIETGRSTPMARESSVTKTKTSSLGASNEKADSMVTQPVINMGTATRLPSRAAPSPQFNTVLATVQDRARFKPLIEVLVAKRRAALADLERVSSTSSRDKDEKQQELSSATEPLRAAVTTALLTSQSNLVSPSKTGSGEAIGVVGAPMSPGAWLQRHGFASFGDLYNEAEQKGFVHLVRSSIKTGVSSSSHADGNTSDSSGTVKDRVRLAERYESMFFPHDEY